MHKLTVGNRNIRDATLVAMTLVSSLPFFNRENAARLLRPDQLCDDDPSTFVSGDTEGEREGEGGVPIDETARF